MTETNAGLFLTNYVYQIPVFLVWIAGAIIAIVRWRSHPRPSRLLILALLILFLRAQIVPIVAFAVAHSDGTLVRIGMTQGIISLASSLVRAGAWILLLVAALGWRAQGEHAQAGITA